MDFIQTGKTFAHGSIILRFRARHVDNNLRAQILDARIYRFHKIIHALVLQPDSIQHAGRRFHHSRIRVAFAMMERRAFHHDAAQSIQIDKIGIFLAIAECARRCKHRIFQRQILDVYF